MEWGNVILGILVVLFVVVIVFAVILAQKSKKSGGPGGIKGAEMEARKDLDMNKEGMVMGPNGRMELRGWQQMYLQQRGKIRNDSAGYGAQRQPHPYDVAVHDARLKTFNARDHGRAAASVMTPQRLAAAELTAWGDDSEQPGSGYERFTPQIGGPAPPKREENWNELVTNLAIDPRTREQHKQWVNEVGPYSQGSFSPDNLDEAVAVNAAHGQGIYAFRRNAVAQGPCTLQITEADAKLYDKEFAPVSFNDRGQPPIDLIT